MSRLRIGSIPAAGGSMLLLALHACEGSSRDDERGSGLDADGDGWSATLDCDDAQATVHPDADEVCDGADNDCDGAADEDAVDAGLWYDDVDGDGYGDAALVSTACDEPFGRVADATDCDDGQEAIHPGAEEHCNDLDDDCDGTADEDVPADAASWCADDDGDGAGDRFDCVLACDAPLEWVANEADCDDADADGTDCRFVALSAGSASTCGLAAGGIVCWGDDAGVVGDVPAGTFDRIAVGKGYACALAAGALTCWGSSSPPAGEDTWTDIDAGIDVACARTSAGAVRCWGALDLDEAGPFLEVSAGTKHACALDGGGEITCWVAANGGPVDPAPPGPWSRVESGGFMACAADAAGVVNCWGSNTNYAPIGTPFDEPVDNLAAGSYHLCALASDGTARCEGWNYDGACEPPDDRFTTLASGGYHTCGITTSGETLCWGSDRDGESSVP